ncbi:MAG: TonB family protein [Uliginosibacterium sp.]|nr:TonB family protein [Uliginosibacterium sp.]
MSTAALSQPFPPDPRAESLRTGIGVCLRLHPLRWPIAVLGACTLTLLMLACLSLTPPPLPRAPTAAALAAILAPKPEAPARQPPDTRPTVAKQSPRASVQPGTGTPRTPPAVLTREEPPSALPPDHARPPAAPTLPSSGNGVTAEANAHATPLANTTTPSADVARPARAVTEDTLAQRCPTQVEPVFPRAAQEDDITQGRVIARLQLDASGAVAGVDVLSAEPAGYFEHAVRRAALQWHCQPTGRAETLRVPFYFRLK